MMNDKMTERDRLVYMSGLIDAESNFLGDYADTGLRSIHEQLRKQMDILLEGVLQPVMFYRPPSPVYPFEPKEEIDQEYERIKNNE